jgi:hypothetical protein
MSTKRFLGSPRRNFTFDRRPNSLTYWASILLAFAMGSPQVLAQSRYATSDSMKGYVHWIDLYDENNAKISPTENPRPYSPEKTCGRCHDYKTISHGWHFNASLTEAKSDSGRPGTPLIWNDPRSGTHLPLSYRGWKGTHKPQDLGLSKWQVAAKLGGFLPGMASDGKVEPQTADVKTVDRTHITGSLPIDCLLCHNRPGSGYSPFVWTEQIEDQNFQYAPTAALGLGVVTGNLRRIKDDVDLNSDEAKELLPKLVYESSKFRSDGKVFIDLIRKPASESCYYCHTNVSSDSVQGSRWLHDDDIHIRAGLQCADCHRNGLDHQTVRGFVGEQHTAGIIAGSLSCQGCHLGPDASTFVSSSGRLGAPRPEHKGMPPLHFEKLSCTACHSGPTLEMEIGRQINAQAHELGSHVKRTGDEHPAIFSNVILPNNSESQYTPHRMMWPSFWGVIKEGKVQPLNPEQAYELIKKPMKIRKDFVDELSEVKLSLSQRKQILGDDKAARLKPEELDEKQRELIVKAESAERKKQVDERMSAALQEIETAFPGTQAVFVSAGSGVAKGSDGKLQTITAEALGDNAKPYAWPSAHMVRPAQQSLGVNGCNECHGKDAAFFYAQLKPVPVLPGQESNSIVVHQLQGADVARLASWSQLFQGRSVFKVAGLIALGLTGLVAFSALAVNLSGLWRNSSKQ